MKAFIPGERVRYRGGNGEYTVAALPDKNGQLPLLGASGLYSMGHTDDLIHVRMDEGNTHSDGQWALLVRVDDLENLTDSHNASIDRMIKRIDSLETVTTNLRNFMSRTTDWIRKGHNV